MLRDFKNLFSYLGIKTGRNALGPTLGKKQTALTKKSMVDICFFFVILGLKTFIFSICCAFLWKKFKNYLHKKNLKPFI